jgi:hypothetical protein
MVGFAKTASKLKENHDLLAKHKISSTAGRTGQASYSAPSCLKIADDKIEKFSGSEIRGYILGPF